LPQGYITHFSEPNKLKENKRNLFLPSAVFTPTTRNYEGWNFNSGNYLFTTDTK